MALEADDSDILNQEAHEEAWSLRRCIMNLCMDIAYVVSNKRIISPKHFSLGLAAHQLSNRSKKLVQLLTQANHNILQQSFRSGYSFS